MPEIQLVWEFFAPKDLSQAHQSIEGSPGKLYGFLIGGTEDVFVQL